MKLRWRSKTSPTLIEFINAMEVREDDEEFKNPVDLMFDALESESQTTSQCGSIRNISWQPVLYALKDFLIKRLGSLLEHTKPKTEERSAKIMRKK